MLPSPRPRWFPLVAVVLFVVGCESAPIQVTPQPDVAAVRTQNEETRQHITATRQHIDKSTEDQVKTEASLESAKKDLDQLLK